MRTGWLLFVIILVGIYVMIRIDFIPDVLPIVGWLDDTFLVGLLLYYFRYKKLPGFLLRLGQWLFQKKSGRSQGAGQKTGTSEQGRTSQDRQSRSGGGRQLKNPYAVLGLKPGASQKEIQAAYREAVQKYHPDKVSHLGEEFQELAQQKFIEVQEAYDELMGKK